MTSFDPEAVNTPIMIFFYCDSEVWMLLTMAHFKCSALDGYSVDLMLAWRYSQAAAARLASCRHQLKHIANQHLK